MAQAIKQTLANVKVSSSPVNVEPIEGTATPLAYLQMTARGAKAYAEGTVPAKGMTFWASLEEANIKALHLDLDTSMGTAALMGKAFDNEESGEFADCDFSVFGTVLPDGKEIESVQAPVAKLRLVEDTRAAFRGDPRGTLQQHYKQIELRTTEVDGETWLLMVGIA